MKKFVIERNLPGAGNLSADELKEMSRTSIAVVNQMAKPYNWICSYITDDKIYCVHEAESEDAVRQHAKLTRFPINTVSEVKVMIDPSTGDA